MRPTCQPNRPTRPFKRPNFVSSRLDGPAQSKSRAHLTSVLLYTKHSEQTIPFKRRYMTLPPSKPEHALTSAAIIICSVIASETHGDRVDAVAFIGCTKPDFRSVDHCQRQETMCRVLTWGFETLPFEHMAEMTSASSTGDLGAFHPEGAVYVARHSARDGWQMKAHTLSARRDHTSRKEL